MYLCVFACVSVSVSVCLWWLFVSINIEHTPERLHQPLTKCALDPIAMEEKPTIKNYY